MGHFQIIPDSKHNIVRVVADGDFDSDMSRKMVANARAVAIQLKRCLLYDLRNVQTSVCEADLYGLLHSLPPLKKNEARSFCAAVLVGGSIPSKLQKFYEHEAGNIDLRVRTFRKAKSALEWLSDQPRMNA